MFCELLARRLGRQLQEPDPWKALPSISPKCGEVTSYSPGIPRFFLHSGPVLVPSEPFASYNRPIVDEQALSGGSFSSRIFVVAERNCLFRRRQGQTSIPQRPEISGPDDAGERAQDTSKMIEDFRLQPLGNSRLLIVALAAVLTSSAAPASHAQTAPATPKPALPAASASSAPAAAASSTP